MFYVYMKSDPVWVQSSFSRASQISISLFAKTSSGAATMGRKVRFLP